MPPVDSIKEFSNATEHLRKVTDDYVQLGVAVLTDNWSSAMKRAGDDYAKARSIYKKENSAFNSYAFLRGYLRRVARELKRPFVYVEEHDSYKSLTIPLQKRTEPLFANYLLAPTTVGFNWKQLENMPLVCRKQVSLITVTFRGDEGEVMLKAFMHKCVADDEVRKVLRTHAG